MIAHQDRDAETPFFQILWNSKGPVLACIVAACAAGVCYTTFSAPIWEAKATIVFPSQNASVLGLDGFTHEGGLMASLAGAPTPLKIYKGFMESERTLNYVSEQTGYSRKQIRSSRVIRDQPMESSLTVTFRDSNTETAVKAVALHLASLEKINDDVARPLITDDSTVLEQQVRDQREIVATLEQKLLAFQNSAVTAPSLSVSSAAGGQVVTSDPAKWRLQQREIEIELRKINKSLQAASDNLDEAASMGGVLPSHIPPAKKWRDRLVELEYELKLKEIEYAPGSPEVRKLQEEVDTTRDQLQSEVEAYVKAVRLKSIDPTSPSDEVPVLLTRRVGLQAQLSAVRRLANLAPGEAIGLSSIVRDLNTQTLVLQKIEQQYKLSQIQAERDTSRWQVLDAPAVGDRPVNKSYFNTVLFSVLIGLIVGALVAVRRENKVVEELPTKLKKVA